MSKLDAINSLVGEEVVVAITHDGYTRNHFDAQISICGILEKHPDDEAFRIVLSKQTFTYFEEEDVISVSTNASKPIIMLTIPVKADVK